MAESQHRPYSNTMTQFVRRKRTGSSPFQVSDHKPSAVVVGLRDGHLGCSAAIVFPALLQVSVCLKLKLRGYTEEALGVSAR